MTVVAVAVLLTWCSAVSVADIRTKRLPDVLTGGGAVCVFGYALATGHITAALAGSLLLVVPYLLVHLIAPAAFGAGDVKLAVGLGAAAGLGGGQAWIWAAVGAPLLTGFIGLAARAFPGPRRSATGHIPDRTAGRGATRRSRAPNGAGPATVPHGPSMCAATVLSLMLW